jgi:hypothetical protein
MNKIVAYTAGAIFLLGIVLRILSALFFPDRFAEGARRVLFLDARQKALFPFADKKTKSQHDPEDQHDNNKIKPLPTKGQFSD